MEAITNSFVFVLFAVSFFLDRLAPKVLLYTKRKELIRHEVTCIDYIIASKGRAIRGCIISVRGNVI